MNRMLLTSPRLARSLGNFAGEFENVMDRFLGEAFEEGPQSVFAPRLDIAEGEQSYEITVDLPGVKSEDVHVEMHEDRLTISGSRESREERKDRQFHRIERSTGAFSRTITLPATVDHEKIEAHYADGVLHVTLPKAEAHQPRKIQVKAGGKQTVEGNARVGESKSSGPVESAVNGAGHSGG